MRYVYKKWKSGDFQSSLDFGEQMSNLMKKLFSQSNPASQLENMMKYGFNMGGRSVMGINDLIRQIRKKKLEQMKKNISGTYEQQKSRVEDVREKELEEVNAKIPEQISDLERKLENMIKRGMRTRQENLSGEGDFSSQHQGEDGGSRRSITREMRRNMRKSGKMMGEDMGESEDDGEEGEERNLSQQIFEDIDKLSQDLMERNEMLSQLPRSFQRAMEKLKDYDEKKGFMSEEAKRMFSELMKDYGDIQRLGEFLKRHPYGFKEGEPLPLQESMETIDRFEELEELEEKLRGNNIQDIPPEVIQKLLGDEEFRSFSTLHRLMEIMKQSGFFVMKGNSIKLTPRGVRKIGDKVLKDIFADIKGKLTGTHSTKKTGNYEVDYEEKKKWEFGDNINVDIFSTLKNAIMNGRFDPSGRVEITPDDFEIFKSRHFSRASCALLIDTSWSMSWGGKFECAKKVAMALHSLISSYFPRDILHIIGFFTVAVEIKPHELPSVELNMNDPFTNMQDAIRLARKLLKRSPAGDKQIIIITDGQPTAYCVGNRVFVEWPVMGVSPNAMRETIKEVEQATRENIRINIFMVEENNQVAKFVEEIVRINRGRAFFTDPENLGKFVLLDFLSRKKKFIRG